MILSFGMEKIENDRAKTLSGGWQRRLSIALALISDPQILFLDEPTLGLDVIARRQLWQMIENLKGRVTIILTTHYLEEAEALSDRIGIMSQGKLKAVGTAAELTAKTNAKNFEDAFIFITNEGGLTS
jgi:ABC-2 type transport system ATP-binding protein